MTTALIAGLGLGLSLIIAIGAQNLFVLRQGIRREHVLAVVVVCAVSDALLIMLGVSGLGLVLGGLPWLVDVVRWAGAAFLVGYGLLAARRAWRPGGAALDAGAGVGHEETGAGTPPIVEVGAAAPRVAEAGAAGAPGAGADAAPTASVVSPSRLTTVVLTCLALTWLNPHVYLDTVFLLGGVANTYGDQRWAFAAGAMLGSVLWFAALGYGARYLGRWLASPRAWRILDAAIAVVMIGLGVSLVVPT